MKTDASVEATRRARSMARRNDGDTPIRGTFSPVPPSLLFPACSSRVSRATITACAARPTRICMCVAENGLGR